MVFEIVARAPNWMGDAAMSIPALRELRRIFPFAKITLCARRLVREIFLDADFVDDFLIIEKGESVFRQAAKWRERKFDLAILLTNSFETAFVAKLGAAQRRVGYANQARSFLLTDAVQMPSWKNQQHEVFYYLNLIAELETRLHGGTTTVWKHKPNASLKISSERQNTAREILRERGADLSKKIVALCPGSTNSRAKRWQAESYAALSDLLKNQKTEVVLIGASEELDVSRRVLDLAETKPILLTGETSLGETIAVLSIADLLVTNDTGPAHLAPAVGTKTIVVFGPTIPATTRPFSELAEIIRKPPECAPCMLRDCPIDHRCMKAISAAEVFEIARQKLFSAK
jgi:heptosyltransferase-2